MWGSSGGMWRKGERGHSYIKNVLKLKKWRPSGGKGTCGGSGGKCKDARRGGRTRVLELA